MRYSLDCYSTPVWADMEVRWERDGHRRAISAIGPWGLGGGGCPGALLPKYLSENKAREARSEAQKTQERKLFVMS